MTIAKGALGWNGLPNLMLTMYACTRAEPKKVSPPMCCEFDYIADTLCSKALF